MQETFVAKAGMQPSSALGKRVFNYVWINKDRFDPHANVRCGVPLHYIDQATANAQKYSDTEVDIWIDFDLVDERTLDIVSQHLLKAGVSNIFIKDLHEIASYSDKKHTLFNPERDLSSVRTFDREKTFEDENIWGRVDLARLLVLQHSLERPEIRDAIYSDFDAPDVLLDDPKAQSRLDENGMIFGAITNDHNETIIENTYFAFRKDKMDDAFLVALVDATTDEVKAGYNGYGPFYQKTEEWFIKRGVDNFLEEASIQVSPPMQYKIPKPTEYEGLCV